MIRGKVSREQGRIHFSLFFRRWKFGCVVFLQRPFGLIASDENSRYFVPLGIWAWQQARFLIIGLNLFFLNFHILIDRKPD